MTDVDSLRLKIKGDASGAIRSINNLCKALDRLKGVADGGSGLSKVTGEMDKLSNTLSGLSKISDLTKNLGKLSKVTSKFGNTNINLTSTINASALSFGNLTTKALASLYVLKRVGNTIASWINKSNEYSENLNLFRVSMGEYADAAQEYAEKVGELMGIDPSTWMRNQGVFMTLGTGFGVATDRAAKMSEQLTQLGYDISSFFNISVEDAMTKLQSGFAGELEPLRRLGYDLSQAKLEAVAFSLGIDKTFKSMTQAEKAQLRYYAIMTQVTHIQGDMARTLEAPANQMRIFKAQVEMAGRALGNIFIPVLNKILPYAIAAVKVLRTLADIIASLAGFTLPDMDFSSSSGATGDIAEDLNEATGSATKLRKTLLGVDELNVLPDTSGGGSGVDASGGGGFDFNLPTYDFISETTTNRVNEIVTKMKEWLGITDDIDTWAELLETKLGTILSIVSMIGTAFTSWKIAKIAGQISSLVTSTEKLTKLKAAMSAFWSTFKTASGIFLILAGIKLLVSGIQDAINGSKELETALSIVGGILAIGAGIALLVGGWVPLLVAAGVAIVSMVVMYWDEVVAIWNQVATWFDTYVIQPVTQFFSNLWTTVSGFFVNLWNDIVAIWNIVATWFDENVIQPVVAAFTWWWDKVSSAASACWDFIVKIFSPIVEWWSKLFKSVWQTVSDVFYNIGVIASGCWEIIKAVWSIFTEWFREKIEPVRELFEFLWLALKVGALLAWDWIKNAFSVAANWFNDKIIKPLCDLFEVLWLFLRVGAVVAWDAIKTTFSKVAEFFSNIFSKAWAGVVKVFSIAGEIFVNIKDAILSAFKVVVNGLIKGLNAIIAVPFNGINRALRAIKNINILGLTPFSNLREISVPVIPYLAGGGVVDAGQMFVANEAGPELVGNVGRKTTVMNNDQIVESVSRGVYQAVVQAMAQSSGNQVVEAKVNDKVLFEVVVNRNRQETLRTGYSPLLGGV